MKLAKITLAKNENGYKCNSCAVCTGLFWIFFTINVGAWFVYFYWYLKKDVTRVEFDTRTQQFTEPITGKMKQIINIKNRTYYFYNNQI